MPSVNCGKYFCYIIIYYSKSYKRYYFSTKDRHPEYHQYDTDTHLGDRPSTPTQQRDERYKLKASRKKSNLSAIPD